MQQQQNGERDQGLPGLLEALTEYLASHFERAHVALVLELARAAFRRVPVEELGDLDVAAVAEQLVDGLAFLDRRGAGQTAVRVFDAPGDGWVPDGTVVEVAAEDGPYLLSTVLEELAALGEPTATVLHPVIGVGRDEQGRLEAIVAARHAPRRESWIHIRLARPGIDDERAALITRRLETVLADARGATRDTARMRDQLTEIAFEVRAAAGSRYPPEDVDETCALLDWLLDDNMILLGYREYDLETTDGRRVAVVRSGSGLGILADERTSAYGQPVALDLVDPGLRARMEDGPLLLVSRTNRPSTVHRRERMLYVGVKKVDGEGRITGEDRFLGLFTDKAYAEPAGEVPVLRRRLSAILEHEDVVEGSHDERALRSLFEALPKQELFQAGPEELRETLVDLIEAEKRQAVRLICRSDPWQASVSALVSLPRERFDPRLRQRVQDLLTTRFGAVGVDYHLSLSDRAQALLHFVLHLPERRVPQVAVDALEREILALSRSWHDELREELVRRWGRSAGEAAARSWGQVFPAGYRDVYSPAQVIDDIAHLERFTRDRQDVGIWVGPDPHDREDRLRVKLYRHGVGVELSAFIPVLESLGLVVVEEMPFELASGDDVLFLHDFGVRVQPGVGLAVGTVDLERDGPRLAEAALAVWEGKAEADSLNRLVLVGQLDWRQLTVLRAYRRYLRQIGTAYSEAYLDEALVGHPHVARALIKQFEASFDPDSDAPGDLEVARGQTLEACEAVERLDRDRILRGFVGLVDATLRTNYFRTPPRPWLSLKFRSHEVPGMPEPRPAVEVFVYSPDLEGIHLRGGPVARGGIRWSDRREDFRTEILGLMKAQMVKNAVIVPTGSKGGFVLSRLATPEAAASAYESYIRALLDITDNVVGDQVVTPDRVRARDGADPYLVVAADKGTAALSDVANAVSHEYGFWLGDAFASGGSRGYDHKAMGITARGAWVAVRRHFRELDVDVQTEPITVAGIGDMTGDVFGNAMLRSDRLLLVAAFDHRHIFLDPDPDPAASYAERERLFRMGPVTWDDYDRRVVSDGGGVWSRHVKAIPLSEQARRVLRVDAESLSPPELVSAILAAPVDLLFAGGIGTFVKASGQPDAEVTDRANDAVRIEAKDLRARVVAEGANLALTQRARVEYARRGGRCNTDAIDNAAGVATSDREVNLKILLGMDDDLDGDERDRLLSSMTDEVASLALRDVDLQTRALSREAATSPGAITEYETLMETLEQRQRAPRLDREMEALPSPDEMRRRAAAGAGLTRPELAVLLAYAKIDLREALAHSPVVDEPALVEALEAAVPASAVARYRELLPAHPLRRELVATTLANDVVNRMGITYAHRVARSGTGGLEDVAIAYWAARETVEADARWRTVEALEPAVPAQVVGSLDREVGAVVDAWVRAYLDESAEDGVRIDVAAVVARDRPAVGRLVSEAAGFGSPRQRAVLRARADALTAEGVDEDVAERFAALGSVTLSPDICQVSRGAGMPVAQVAQVFHWLDEQMPLEDVVSRIREAEVTDPWEGLLRQALEADLGAVRRDAAARALATGEPDARAAVAAFLSTRSGELEHVTDLTRRLRQEPEAGSAALAVVVRALQQL